jgi:hypothetical protein
MPSTAGTASPAVFFLHISNRRAKTSMKYFSDFYISYRIGSLSMAGTSRRKEIRNMELVIQWILFICGEDGPIIGAPASGG